MSENALGSLLLTITKKRRFLDARRGVVGVGAMYDRTDDLFAVRSAA
jgi:hypothetical protein